MKTTLSSDKDFSVQIAGAIRDAIISGQLIVDARLPSESEMADQFGVRLGAVLTANSSPPAKGRVWVVKPLA